jgi:polar amino acid transport system substrate-binding protein
MMPTTVLIGTDSQPESESGKERPAIVLFSQPYLEFNQGVAINRLLTPDVSSVAGLRGLTAGIQSRNTSDAVAKRWLAEGAIAGIRSYPYDGIATALDDLEAGRIGFVVKMFPVISWLVQTRPVLPVVMQVPTHEKPGIAFAKNNTTLGQAMEAAVQTLRANRTFSRLQAHWFPAAL